MPWTARPVRTRGAGGDVASHPPWLAGQRSCALSAVCGRVKQLRVVHTQPKPASRLWTCNPTNIPETAGVRLSARAASRKLVIVVSQSAGVPAHTSCVLSIVCGRVCEAVRVVHTQPKPAVDVQPNEHPRDGRCASIGPCGESQVGHLGVCKSRCWRPGTHAACVHDRTRGQSHGQDWVEHTQRAGLG